MKEKPKKATFQKKNVAVHSNLIPIKFSPNKTDFI